MQPLSRVKPNTKGAINHPNTMPLRPVLAMKIASCLSQWAAAETMLGISLALMMEVDEDVMLAMYNSLENRAAQLRLLQACADAKLDLDRSDLLRAILQVYIKPAMKQRDKLAHWIWGYSNDLPDALLLTEPSHSMFMHMRAAGDVAQYWDEDRIYVIREPDLDGILRDIAEAIRTYGTFMGTFWRQNSPESRAELLRQLSSEHQIHSAMDRHRASQGKTPLAPPQVPQSAPNG